jgi:hypothetical protein
MHVSPSQLAAASEYALRLKAFNARFTPQPVQLGPLKALFKDGCKRIFMRFGRQTGKSVTIAAMAVRWCLLNPGSTVFIIGPTSIQTRQIYLHSGLIEKMIPPEYADSIHKTDARFQIGDSSIRLYGADNQEALRGLTASLVLCDELKDLSRELIDSIITPALLVRGAPLVLSGTPPGSAVHFYWSYVQEAEASTDWQVFRASSYDNIYTPAGAVEAERKAHEARGTLDVFKREFLGEYCPDSQNLVFPIFDVAKHVAPWAETKREFRARLGQWRLVVSCDPGSTFAVMIMAVNEYTKRVLILDEVYETSQEENALSKLWPRVTEKLNNLVPAHYQDDEPIYVYDCAATWFHNELRDRFGVNAWPSRKAQNAKDSGLTMIKDLLVEKKVLISASCKGLITEMQGYQLGANGLPVKRGDHQIDNFRYALGILNYSPQAEDAPPTPAELPIGMRDDPKRAFRIEDDFPDDSISFDGDDEPFSLDIIE